MEFSYANYDKLKFDIALEEEGDVHARLYIRIKEVRIAIHIIEQAVRNTLYARTKKEERSSLKKNSCAIGITEGWRGEIVLFSFTTDSSGNIRQS